jgi:hypothetical protein
MKAMLVMASDKVADLSSYYLRPLGFDIIRYRNPVKAMDNVDEVEPDAIIVSAEDFPRHWKPFIQMIRMNHPKEKCIFLLLKGDRFPFDEAAKAVFLGVNGVVHENLKDKAELSRFQQVLKRYLALDDMRAAERFVPSIYDRLDFTFAHPETFAIVTGKIESISTRGISFRPDSHESVDGLTPGMDLPDCSIRIGEDIRSFACKLSRNGPVIALEFSGASEADRELISRYLASYAERSEAIPSGS